tara:strand:+ start:63 stop:482 length:420 start_codon:yes stop_codon:yes gene_type:complete
MTYKELLFKMADKGMLTLSTQKDGRGLFWAGMDNMEALEQPFDWGDFEHQYSKSDVDAMRETLHESEWEGMKDRELKKMLWEGSDGWENVTDRDVIDMYENIYGETDNVEIVQDKKVIICDKNINSQQGEMTAKFNDIK